METPGELIAKLPAEEGALLCRAAPALEHLFELFAGAQP